MNRERARKLITKYRYRLQDEEKVEGPYNRKPSLEASRAHAHGMLDKMEIFLDKIDYLSVDDNPYVHPAPAGVEEIGKIWSKFNRWLGFLQAILWLAGDYTLDEMRLHNKDEVDFELLP